MEGKKRQSLTIPPNPPTRKTRWARKNFFDVNYWEIENEYLPNNDYLEDGELVEDIKDVIFEDLTIPERRIFLTYTYYQHAGKTAKKLKIDAQHIYKIIKVIRNKIKVKLHERISAYNSPCDTDRLVGFYADDKEETIKDFSSTNPKHQAI